jgi:hypothetical protein
LVAFRCTQRVAKRFRLRLAESPPPSSGLLGDWYANLLNVGRSRLVLCLSERSLLPVILPARNDVFPAQFPEFLAEVLRGLQLAPERIEEEVAAAREVVFGKPRSRNVLGALNDFGFHAWHELADPRFQSTPLRTALRLAEMPSKPIGYSSPDRVVHSLFQSSGLS